MHVTERKPDATDGYLMEVALIMAALSVAAIAAVCAVLLIVL
jgi:hypothetical protein